MPVDGGRNGGDVRAGALERCGPHPRGRLALERGGPRPRGRLALERGGPRPRGHPLCYPSGPRGPPGLWSCRARVLVSWVRPCFSFFAGFKQVSPGYLGDPHSCPWQKVACKTWKPFDKPTWLLSVSRWGLTSSSSLPTFAQTILIRDLLRWSFFLTYRHCPLFIPRHRASKSESITCNEGIDLEQAWC
jgi:hypothetical protein